LPDVARMSLTNRLEVVVRRAAALVPGDAGRRLAELVSPEALAIIAGIVTVWAASHFVGVGEIADVALLVGGWLTIGAGAVAGCRKLLSFGLGTYNARTEADLERAAKDLAEAVGILGIDVALGLLFKGRPKGTFGNSYEGALPPIRRALPQMPRAGPLHRYEFRIIYTRGKFAGQGGTTPTNVARIGRDAGGQSVVAAARDMRKAAHHEVVHLWLNRAFSALGRPAIYARMGAYKRSYILRYLEEAMAEARSQRLVPRIEGEVPAYKFPLNPTYDITRRKMGAEAKGVLLGPVTVSGATWQAWYGLASDN